MRKLLWRTRPLTVILAIACSFLFVAPIVAVIATAFRSDGEWTGAVVEEIYTARATYVALGNSILYALVCAAVATVIGGILAWLATRTNSPFRRALTPTMLLLILVPSVYYTLAWGLLGHPRIGSIHAFFNAMWGIDAPGLDIYSIPGFYFVTILRLLPLVYFLLLGPVSAMDSAQEEAATMAGARRMRILLQVNAGALRPSLLGTFLLSMVLTLEFLEIPLILAAPMRHEVTATYIYNFLTDDSGENHPPAAAVALALIGLVAVLLLLKEAATRGREYVTVGGRSRAATRVDLGRSRWIGGILIALFVAVAVVLPLGQLVVASAQPFFGVYGAPSLENYEALLADRVAIAAVQNTLIVAVVGGFVAMALAVSIGIVARNNRGPLARYVSWTTWLPWAVPGTALVVGMLATYLAFPPTRAFYGSIAFMFIGLVVAVTPVAVRAAEGAITQVSAELQEAAWVAGAPPARAALRITIPIIARSFMGGWLLAGVVIAGNLTIPLLMGSPTEPMVASYAYQAYLRGAAPEAAALFVSLAVALTAAYLLLVLISAGLKRRRPRPPRTGGIPSPAPAIAANQLGELSEVSALERKGS
ncbi:ABC transporter permease [Microbacterium sp. A94]|uniref:ABC transporter permease n=1 Tax=Microbacterium sp. A94 TaxID=3450717 RepID=UPI003F425556